MRKVGESERDRDKRDLFPHFNSDRISQLTNVVSLHPTANNEDIRGAKRIIATK